MKKVSLKNFVVARTKLNNQSLYVFENGDILDNEYVNYSINIDLEK